MKIRDDIVPYSADLYFTNTKNIWILSVQPIFQIWSNWTTARDNIKSQHILRSTGIWLDMADSIPRIGAMLQSARELTLEAANAVSSRLVDETAVQPKDIAKFLNSRTDRDKLTGLKQVISVCLFAVFDITHL